jgi:outer membrane protein assembly factor BamB
MTRIRLAAAVLLLTLASPVRAGDWPQFMRVAEHTGDAADETLTPPLKLRTQVQLDDAILASPAVVAGRVYVVDQMGRAYCVEPKIGVVLWRSHPDGADAKGGNTSSPCVAKGRVYFGTTAGKVHVLDTADGRVLASVDVGSPVTGSLTFANDSLYFQTVGAKVVRMDLAGKVVWEYDHYATYKNEDPRFAKDGNSRALASDKPMYGGGEVAVSGKRVFVNLGWDVFSLEDMGAAAKLAWCDRCPLFGTHRGSGISWMGIAGGAAVVPPFVYWAYPGCETVGDIFRTRLDDGFTDPVGAPKDYVWVTEWRQHWAIFSTVAARGETVYAQSHRAGVVSHTFGKGTNWRAYSYPDYDLYPASTPGTGGVVLTKDQAVFGTISGELWTVALESKGAWPKFTPEPFVFRTPSGKFISTTPAVADGCVYFGSDDGCLYGLSADGARTALPARADLHLPRSAVKSPTGKRYPHPGPYGNQTNANFVDDPALKPPLKLRWAARTGAIMRAPLVASEEDVFVFGMDGTLAAVEQETGRIRWRKRLDGPTIYLLSALYDSGRLYVPWTNGTFYCLNASDGSVKWSRPMGAPAGPYPVLAGGVVAFASIPKGTKSPVLQAWDADTGAERWQVAFGEYKESVSVSGCVLDGVMYFSCGSVKEPGRTCAVEARTGNVLWKNEEQFCDNRAVIAGADGRLFVSAFFGGGMRCLKASDGSLVWTKKDQSTYRAPSVSPTRVTSRSYGGGQAPMLDPATGKFLMRGRDVVAAGAPNHTCGPVTLTSADLSLAVTVSGLHVRDLATGQIAWSSLGFAPRACAGICVSSGRVFYHPQNGMLYCFEPEKK